MPTAKRGTSWTEVPAADTTRPGRIAAVTVSDGPSGDDRCERPTMRLVIRERLDR